MGVPDLNAFTECSREYSRLYSDLERQFDCEWDDKVHDSFAVYKNMIHKYSDRICAIKQNAEKLLIKIETIEAEGIIDRSKELVAEAESV